MAASVAQMGNTLVSAYCMKEASSLDPLEKKTILARKWDDRKIRRTFARLRTALWPTLIQTLFFKVNVIFLYFSHLCDRSESQIERTSALA